MSSRKATESFCFVHTTQYIYEEDKKSALDRLGRQATFKFRALWSVRDGKGLKYYCTQSFVKLRHLSYRGTSFCMPSSKKFAANPFSQSCRTSFVSWSNLILWPARNFVRWINDDVLSRTAMQHTVHVYAFLFSSMCSVGSVTIAI